MFGIIREIKAQNGPVSARIIKNVTDIPAQDCSNPKVNKA